VFGSTCCGPSYFAPERASVSFHGAPLAAARRVAHSCRAPGFVIDLPEKDEVVAQKVLELIRGLNWLDSQTRALFMEFSLYLAPSDLMLSARLVVEVHESGTTWTDLSLEPINLGLYRISNRGQLALYIIGVIVVIMAMVWDLRSTWNLRLYQARRTGSVRH
jgi:hypothetical protein